MGRATYLAVAKSEFGVYVGAKAAGEPLYRYEYDRGITGGLPAAHLQVHAHRDGLTYVMARAGNQTKRGRARAAGNEVPRMSELHFPLGGHRFRPALEDVLEMLVTELGVDHEEGRQRSLREGRRTWRLTQTQAVVRDSPRTAAASLRELGYTVTPPDGGDPVGNPDRLIQP